jgi:hypothetical protein
LLADIPDAGRAVAAIEVLGAGLAISDTTAITPALNAGSGAAVLVLLANHEIGLAAATSLDAELGAATCVALAGVVFPGAVAAGSLGLFRAGWFAGPGDGGAASHAEEDARRGGNSLPPGRLTPKRAQGGVESLVVHVHGLPTNHPARRTRALFHDGPGGIDDPPERLAQETG